jgi:hypothetical protein
VVAGGTDFQTDVQTEADAHTHTHTHTHTPDFIYKACFRCRINCGDVLHNQAMIWSITPVNLVQSKIFSFPLQRIRHVNCKSGLHLLLILIKVNMTALTRPIASVNDRPVLSSERAPHINKPAIVCHKKNSFRLQMQLLESWAGHDRVANL